ncbi:MAG: hypothetical protein V9E90_02295 [Saprospiraceae bacterium]
MVNAKKTGFLWSDVKKIDKLLRTFPSQLRGKTEKEFSMALSPIIMGRLMKGNSKNNVIAEIDKRVKVDPVHCFGKKNRPDLTVNNNGIAVEFKLCNSTGLAQAIGQGMIYRMKYKFVFLVLILKIRKENKTILFGLLLW